MRELNEQLIDSSRKAGLAFLDTYEKSLRGVADFQERIGDNSPVEWFGAVAHAQAQITRELATAYTSAARGLFRS